MKYIKTYENFHSYQVNIPDDPNFKLIFEALVESQLTPQERAILFSEWGQINESWWSDLSDKASRGVLKIKTSASQLLNDLAAKAKDLLDFAKQLASKIGEYVKGQFNTLKEKVKGYALKDMPFAGILLEFIENKKLNKLKTYLQNTLELIEYIVGGKMYSDLVTRLSECFSKVLAMGTNEGLYNFEKEFLFEADQAEQKSFLQRLGEKVASFPPFSWLPKIEEVMKTGISALSKIVDKFFSWLLTGDVSMVGSKFAKSFNFLFQILELYAHYKILGKIDKFKDLLKNASGLEDITNDIKDKTLDAVWDLIGINGEEVVSGIKEVVKKIPFFGQIFSVLDGLVIAIGTFIAFEPTLKRIVS